MKEYIVAVDGCGELQTGNIDCQTYLPSLRATCVCRRILCETLCLQANMFAKLPETEVATSQSLHTQGQKKKKWTSLPKSPQWVRDFDLELTRKRTNRFSRAYIASHFHPKVLLRVDTGEVWRSWLNCGMWQRTFFWQQRNGMPEPSITFLL